jgi:hypothetical protein
MRVGAVETLLGQPLIAHRPEHRRSGGSIHRPEAREDEQRDAGSDRNPHNGQRLNQPRRRGDHRRQREAAKFFVRRRRVIGWRARQSDRRTQPPGAILEEGRDGHQLVIGRHM